MTGRPGLRRLDPRIGLDPALRLGSAVAARPDPPSPRTPLPAPPAAEGLHAVDGWPGIRERVRGVVGPGLFAAVVEPAHAFAGADGRLSLAVPNAFAADLLRERLAAVGAICEVIVDPSLAALSGAQTAPAPDDPAPQPAEVVVRPRVPLVTCRFLAERAFFMLTPGGRPQRFSVVDLRGSLHVIPSADGPPGPYELTVLTALVSMWAHGPRSAPVVEASLAAIARAAGLAWGGRTAMQLRGAIETLKATTYRAEADGEEVVFSLLDEIRTTWTGPATTPYRNVRATFSAALFAELTVPRVLRPLDAEALRALGPRRSLARRLFVLLEGLPGHQRDHGLDVVERLVDARLLATLGLDARPWRARQLIGEAGAAIVASSSRYRRVELLPRRKAFMVPGEPRLLLSVSRRRR